MEQDEWHAFGGRRRFLSTAAALTGSALIGRPCTALAEPPPEVKTVRFVHAPAMCLAPQYLAEDLLRAEGFREGAVVGGEGRGGEGEECCCGECDGTEHG